MEQFNFKQWCQNDFSKLLGFKIEDELLEYLLSIETEKDSREYLHALLTSSNVSDRDKVMAEFFRHWRPPSIAPDMEELVRPDEEQMVLFAGRSQQDVGILYKLSVVEVLIVVVVVS